MVVLEPRKEGVTVGATGLAAYVNDSHHRDVRALVPNVHTGLVPKVYGVFQIGTDQAHPESWPAQVVTQGRTHKFANLPIGQSVCVRVAVIRRGPILPIQVR